MTLTPFTKEHAAEIAEDFEDLIDTSFRGADGITYSINNVMICPFGADEQAAFAASYHASQDTATSLKRYSTENYDVMVFAFKGRSEDEYVALDIRTYTDQQGIRYNFEMDAH